MIQDFQNFIGEQELCQKGDPLLLAVSGGVDSVVMADLFARSGFTFAIAHCNFGLRGNDSNEDEALVEQLAAHYGVPLYTQSMNPSQLAADEGISIQMAAREMRYEWLEKIRYQNGFAQIATAHHKDDSVETVLLNLAKGTGIRGLHGILPKRGHVIRPLLFAWKSSINQYATERHLHYREDATNKSLTYERNYLRHQVIPAFATLNPSFRQTMASNIRHFAEAEAIYEQGLHYYRKKLLSCEGQTMYLSIRKLRQYEGAHTILFELLKPYGFGAEQVAQIFEELEQQPGKQFFTNEYRLVKDRKFLIIVPKNDEVSGPFFIHPHTKQLTVREGQLRFQLAPVDKIKVKADPSIAFIDYAKLTFPLTLRRWQEGDYFYPLVDESKGQKAKKKKLKRYFADIKLSIVAKERMWVLTSGQRIVWIPGYRLDNRFKVTSQTDTIYKVRWFPE